MCGSPLKEGSKFCPKCGQIAQSQPVPQNNSDISVPKKRKVSIATLVMSGIALILAIALAVVLFVLPSEKIAGVKLTGKTFRTPKEAVEYFADGVKDCDLQKMSEAFGIEKSAEGFDFQYQSERLKVIMPATLLMPDNYSQYTSLNKIQRLGQSITTYKQILYLMNGIDWSTPISKDVDEEYIKDYVKKINPDSLKDIKITIFRDFSMADSEKHLENMKKAAKVYGADEAKIYEVEMECNGIKISCDTVQMIRYGDSWYINSLLFNEGGL
jgi:hypothetical protein